MPRSPFSTTCPQSASTHRGPSWSWMSREASRVARGRHGRYHGPVDVSPTDDPFSFIAKRFESLASSAGEEHHQEHPHALGLRHKLLMAGTTSSADQSEGGGEAGRRHRRGTEGDGQGGGLVGRGMDQRAAGPGARRFQAGDSGRRRRGAGADGSEPERGEHGGARVRPCDRRLPHPARSSRSCSSRATSSTGWRTRWARQRPSSRSRRRTRRARCTPSLRRRPASASPSAACPSSIRGWRA